MDSKRGVRSKSIGTNSSATRPSNPGRNSEPTGGRRRESHGKSPRESAQSTLQGETLVKAKIPEESSQPSEASRTISSKNRSLSEVSTSNVRSLNLAIVGAPKVGKSTFIEIALDRPKPVTGPISIGKVSLEKILYRLQLVELSIDGVHFRGRRRLAWPAKLGQTHIPHIDGVVCLYDVTEEESIADIPEFLATCRSSRVPCVPVAWKCDSASAQRQALARFSSQLDSAFPAIELYALSRREPEGPKRCLLSIIKLANATFQASGLDYAQSTEAQDSIVQSTSDTGTKANPHVRSKSELPLRSGRSQQLPKEGPLRLHPESVSNLESKGKLDKKQAQPLSIDTSPTISLPLRHPGPQTPPSSTECFFHGLSSPTESRESETPQTPESLYMKTMFRPGTADTYGHQIHRTFLDMGADSHDEERSSSDTESPKLPSNSLREAETLTEESGSTFDELIEQLLMLPRSKAQVKFVPIFLCLYRAFATPLQLLNAVLSRFDEVEKSKDVRLTKAGEQLRYLQVLAQWTGDYPEDFSLAPVRSVATVFLSQIGESKIFMGAAKEISNNLDLRTKDEDLDWAYSDKNYPQPPSKIHTIADATSRKDAKTHRPVAENEEDSDGSSHGVDPDSSPRFSGTPSTASSLLRTTNPSSQSLANLLTLEQARHDAVRLKPIPRNRLTKLQWHQFMDTPPMEFALEVTRIDWTMYRAIRPRDFIRHVTLSGEGRRLSHHGDNIGMMVKHFNHLALFVSSMILLRDKPKHRAKALERFMEIAWKVRQLNNYNSLGAIVAGINGPEIQRLGMTRELVPQSIQKDFLRLTILMSHSRSHAAYRMAWENSPAERIPFIPLVRQDLTRAEMGNQTFIGPEKDKIHWKKYEIMGEVVLGIQRSQQLQYSFPQRNEDVTKLILETRVLEGSEDAADPRDELQRRSELLEPAGVMVDPSRKKFDWFRR